MKRKYLDFVATDRDPVAVQITNQEYIGAAFNRGDQTFYSSNGLKLTSCHSPEVQLNEIFVRGSRSSKNFVVIYLPKYLYTAFCFAVEEYNESFKEESEALEQTKTNLVTYMSNKIRELEEFLKDAEQATNPAELIAVKKEYLLTLADIPIDCKTCFYCVKRELLFGTAIKPCNTCEYGKKHGLCSDKNSDFGKIREQKRLLLEALQKY